MDKKLNIVYQFYSQSEYENEIDVKRTACEMYYT